MFGGRRHATPQTAVIAALALAFAAGPAKAGEITAADLNAAVRSLGFLETLQNRPQVLVGVVYNGADPVAKAAALRAAGELSRLAGPGSATVSAVVVAVQDLAGQRYDAVYLMPLAPDAGRAAGEFVRRQGVVSVSADPACLEAQSCVLWVQARSSMSVVLDTALAKTVGARFSTVFTMLVKRK